MKMVTLLAGKQLQRDVAKKRPNTMGSVREESFSNLNGDTGLLLRHLKGRRSRCHNSCLIFLATLGKLQ